MYQQIDRRMEQMIKKGLFEEVKSLIPHQHLNALQTLGYTEIFGYYEGKYDQRRDHSSAQKEQSQVCEKAIDLVSKGS